MGMLNAGFSARSSAFSGHLRAIPGSRKAQTEHRIGSDHCTGRASDWLRASRAQSTLRVRFGS
jgi:hypothetical protein